MNEAVAGAERPFDLLHPVVQHHIVNTLGWHSLRTHQEEAIVPILRGAHVLVQAPTAGGKTEAAMLPLLSRMVADNWSGQSVLYLCPIKALLNNLESRLTLLTGMVGRAVGVWHGDVNQSTRKRLLRDQRDVLLTTPESLEVMLVSRLVDHKRFFGSLRAVVVDEVHAFAGDDRGWHLLALLERLSALAPAPFQRVALSATLANPDALLTWLTAQSTSPKSVVRGAVSAASTADVQLDYVGSLNNAALVLSRLHRGEKRLVFCDSRSQVEALGQELRAHGVRTFVSHSSLGVDERRSAEHAFSEGSDCVIVATSTLELGIDVGDLDRVVQINAPSTVASFLQRLGRTGRRPGSRRNCLFLAIDEDALLRAAGLLRLWEDGFVEPVRPPALPYHVFAQQIMAQILQDGGGTPRTELLTRLAGWLVTAEISDLDVDAILAHLFETGVLFADGPIVMLGPEGEARYGAKHFLELFSVFNTPPLVTVYHGVAELGQVDPLSFLRRDDEPPLLALGGRGWRVTHMDWPRKRAWVEPSAYHGRSRWLGGGPPMHFALGQAVAGVLRDGLPERLLSQRARSELSRVRTDYSWVEENATVFVVTPPDAGGRWWTFAGDRCNAALVQQLKARGVRCSSDALGVTVLPSAGSSGEVMTTDDTHAALVKAQHSLTVGESLEVAEEATKAMKFAECVPSAQLALEASVRFGPGESATTLASWPVRIRIMSPLVAPPIG